MSTFELVIREKAQQQILDIYSYYEDLQPGLGDRFEAELDLFFDLLEQGPRQFQAVDKVFRRAHLQTFPYTLFYFVLESRVYLVAVWPQAGKSDAWLEVIDPF
ncbi:MAG: type II toxin-antitoxin system RelE/ParE family toxin [Bacteroidota bacterium]